MIYNNLPKEIVLKIHSFAMERRKQGFGQRKIFNMIKEKFKVEIKEGTIANWIFSNSIPFGNEKTQFKKLPIPKKNILYDLYINKKLSAQKIAQKYKVSTIIIINWLKEYNIPTRTHLESMNTPKIKNELREKKLRKPNKIFSKLSPEKAYILGVLCGDGHINKKMIRFEIRNDEEFIKKFSESFKKVYGLNFNYKYYKKRNSLVLYVASEIICEDLLNYGNFGTFEWRVPNEVMNSNNKNILSNFLKGIYDSEGSITKSCILMSASNKKGIKDISFLLKKLGIENKIGITKINHYILWIFRKERFKIFRYRIGFTIKRKQDKLNEILKNDRVYKPA